MWARKKSTIEKDNPSTSKHQAQRELLYMYHPPLASVRVGQGCTRGYNGPILEEHFLYIIVWDATNHRICYQGSTAYETEKGQILGEKYSFVAQGKEFGTVCCHISTEDLWRMKYIFMYICIGGPHFIWGLWCCHFYSWVIVRKQ